MVPVANQSTYISRCIDLINVPIIRRVQTFRRWLSFKQSGGRHVVYTWNTRYVDSVVGVTQIENSDIRTTALARWTARSWFEIDWRTLPKTIESMNGERMIHQKQLGR